MSADNVALIAVASAANSNTGLSDLGTALHDARFSKSEDRLKRLCSRKLGDLVGLSKKSILDVLGNPDLNEDVVSGDSDFSLLHYYINPKGTTVTFTVGARNVVTSVSCR